MKTRVVVFLVMLTVVISACAPRKKKAKAPPKDQQPVAGQPTSADPAAQKENPLLRKDAGAEATKNWSGNQAAQPPGTPEKPLTPEEKQRLADQAEQDRKFKELEQERAAAAAREANPDSSRWAALAEKRAAKQKATRNAGASAQPAP